MLLNIVGSSIKATKGGLIMENRKTIKKENTKSFINAVVRIMVLIFITNFWEAIITYTNSYTGKLTTTLLLLVCSMNIVVDIIIAVINMVMYYSELIKESVEL